MSLIISVPHLTLSTLSTFILHQISHEKIKQRNKGGAFFYVFIAWKFLVIYWKTFGWLIFLQSLAAGYFAADRIADRNKEEVKVKMPVNRS